MNDIETEEKRATPYDTKDKSHTNQNPGVLVSNSEVGREAPTQDVSSRLRTRVKKYRQICRRSGPQHGRASRNETNRGNSDLITTKSEEILPRDPRAVDTRRRRRRQKRQTHRHWQREFNNAEDTKTETLHEATALDEHALGELDGAKRSLLQRKGEKGKEKNDENSKKMQVPKQCNPASYETRGKRKADRISGKERRNARNNTNQD